ncbi:MAG: UvrD-helicase domain-containing protein [Acidobacteria bacterium]|nr:UvrD-helicase domain-containing protein [Acidobacteriota bacterium]
MNLTPDQKRAATAVGSVAVTAGAGTGKTSMLAARYLHHVQTDGMSPLSVVAVTFTDKAADELRSRIRKTLNAELGDEKVIAEVEAAQISTMHALASRICRDFYDLAEIPPDFSILDDTAKPLWMAEKFEEAVSLIDPDIFRTLGFSWLTSAISVLLKDPYSSDQALSLGADQWKDTIERLQPRRLQRSSLQVNGVRRMRRYMNAAGKTATNSRQSEPMFISAMTNPKKTLRHSMTHSRISPETKVRRKLAGRWA